MRGKGRSFIPRTQKHCFLAMHVKMGGAKPKSDREWRRELLSNPILILGRPPSLNFFWWRAGLRRNIMGSSTYSNKWEHPAG